MKLPHPYLPLNKNMNQQNWILHLHYHQLFHVIHLLFPTKKMTWQSHQRAQKDPSMTIAPKRNSLVLFQLKRLPLVLQLMGSLAPLSPKRREGKVYQRSLPSLPMLLNLEDGGSAREISLPNGLPDFRKTQLRDPWLLPNLQSLLSPPNTMETATNKTDRPPATPAPCHTGTWPGYCQSTLALESVSMTSIWKIVLLLNQWFKQWLFLII